MREFFLTALDNIWRYGDTDIFLFPVENYVLRDKKQEVLHLLMAANADFDNQFTQNPPSHVNVLAPVGLTGYRWATQLDPFWNAFLLGLTLSLGKEIEKSRIPLERKTVFSYRIDDEFSQGSIFRKDISWRDFLFQSIEYARDSSFVVLCDISDCYQRIPHHRLENALKQLPQKGSAPKYIMDILSGFSHARSYSVPVGGPASRILVESLLNLTDQLLRNNNIKFARYADDYTYLLTL